MSTTPLKLLLLDGSPTGAKLVEVGGKIIKALIIPRSRMDELSKRDDLNQSGIYFLFGTDSEGDEEKDQVYVGIATNLAKRLSQHKKDENKSFWRVAIACTTKDNSLSASATNYLERTFHQMAIHAGRVDVLNSNTPVENPLSEIEQSEIDDYARDVRTILSVFGYTFLEKITDAAPANEELYYCKGPNADAMGQLTDEGFVVLKNSLLRTTHAESSSEYLRRKLDSLLKQGFVENKTDEQGIFTKDYLFDSPSAASSIVLGRSSNGWTQWKDKNGVTLNENKRSE